MPNRIDAPDLAHSADPPVLRLLAAEEKEISFVHYWDAVQERLALISAVPRTIATSQSANDLWGDDDYYDDAPGQLDDDVAMALGAARIAGEAFRDRRRFLLMLSFRHSSISSRRSHQKIISFIEQIPAELRSYLVLRIVRVRPGTPNVSLFECISFARALTPHVCVHTTPAMLVGDFLQGSGASGISLSCNRFEKQPANAGPDAIRLQVRQARNIAKTVLIEGVADREHFDLCATSGARFLAGPAIVEPCESILGPLQVPRDKVVERIAVV